MIEAVLVFAFLTALLEAIVLSHLAPKRLLNILGAPLALHIVAFVLNLAIHYGTVTGTMTAVTAALASMGCCALLRAYHGHISGRKYYPGFKKYDPAILR